MRSEAMRCRSPFPQHADLILPQRFLTLNGNESTHSQTVSLSPFPLLPRPQPERISFSGTGGPSFKSSLASIEGLEEALIELDAIMLVVLPVIRSCLINNSKDGKNLSNLRCEENSLGSVRT